MATPAPEPIRLDTRRPFSRADARAARIPLNDLLDPRKFRKLIYDRYVAASVPVTLELRAEAALLVSAPGSYISHFTAADLWGGIVPPSPDVHVSGPDQHHRCRRRMVKAHMSDGRPAPLQHRGLPVSSPTQTFLDLAGAGLCLVDLVVLGDSLVKAGRCIPTDLVEAADDWTGRAARLARRAARYVRAGVDSAMESRLRMLIVLAGLPEPQVNAIISGPDGRWLMRFDLFYAEHRLLVEYDGRQHAEDSRQWHHDIARREELDRQGLRLLVITGRDFYADPERVLIRVRDTLRERGATGLRRSFKPEWRAHFPSRG